MKKTDEELLDGSEVFSSDLMVEIEDDGKQFTLKGDVEFDRTKVVTED